MYQHVVHGDFGFVVVTTCIVTTSIITVHVSSSCYMQSMAINFSTVPGPGSLIVFQYFCCSV